MVGLSTQALPSHSHVSCGGAVVVTTEYHDTTRVLRRPSCDGCGLEGRGGAF